MSEQAETTERGYRKVREGVVVSDKMEKTVVVKIEELKAHPVYKKVVRVSRRLKAHDETNQCKQGDRVRIMETRPLSKDKRWRVLEIVHKAE